MQLDLCNILMFLFLSEVYATMSVFSLWKVSTQSERCAEIFTGKYEFG